MGLSESLNFLLFDGFFISFRQQTIQRILKESFFAYVAF
jgi:hypothetical protein